jgi:hypothetical protein
MTILELEEFRQNVLEKNYRIKTMINDRLQSKLDAVTDMGINELEHFKMQAINSLLDTKAKCYIFDVINKRVAILNSDACVVLSEDIDFD